MRLRAAARPPRDQEVEVHVGKFTKLGTLFVVLAAVCALVAGTASGGRRQLSAAPPGPTQLTAAQWNAIVSKARQEGSVALYGIGAPTGYAALAAKFKQVYGINVTVNRQVDNTLLAQINAEE